MNLIAAELVTSSRNESVTSVAVNTCKETKSSGVVLAVLMATLVKFIPKFTAEEVIYFRHCVYVSNPHPVVSQCLTMLVFVAWCRRSNVHPHLTYKAELCIVKKYFEAIF